MALPTSYLTSFKNLSAILDSIKKAQAPDRFTVKFLQDLGYTSAADRLVIKMLKTLGMLRESGEPTSEYHEYLDPSQSGRVLADGLHNAYADLFQINKNAQDMTNTQVRAKFKTISQGAYSDSVLGKMANTFLAFTEHADFGSQRTPADEDTSVHNGHNENTVSTISDRHAESPDKPSRHARLVYEINIHLSATRDPAVYEALFSSLSKHLDI
jgi:hypothetical protein